MSLFLHVVPVSDAIAMVRRLAVRTEPEKVPVEDAFCRVLAGDVRADVDIPGFTRSVVDGYAVRAADTTGAGDAIPSMLTSSGRIAMGATTDRRVGAGECTYVPTGGILPDGADAVVMIEHTELFGDNVLVRKPVAHGENVLFYNEDFAQGEIVLTAGKRLSAQDTGVLAAVGCVMVPVARMPRVGIISTGNELVPVSEIPRAGQVRDVNTYVVSAYVRDHGCIPVVYGIIRDDREPFRAALTRAVAECDAVILSGGSSKDDRDMAAAIIAEQGEVLIHGVAIAPGKPTIIGRCGTVPVIGLPGHPASAFIVLLVIGRHLLTGMTGETGTVPVMIPATLALNVPSARGREDYVRVSLKDGIATPLFGKSGLLNTLVKSNGVVRVPAESEGLETGSTVEVILW
ncbi:MAG: molybdopterin molybdotransferase MoeA [Methanoregula sp.]|nr:molybdopterin molybdotransferase MoeA [Methanoregula sp.]